MKIVIRTPRYERLSTSPNTSSEVTSFLAVEGIGLIRTVTIGFLVIFSIEFFHAYAQKNTIFHVENLVQQSVNATSSPSVTRKQLLLVLNCNSHLSCPFV